VQLLVRTKLQISRVRSAYDGVWETVVDSDASFPDELARLERIVTDFEMRIPTGSVARQFNLKMQAPKKRFSFVGLQTRASSTLMPNSAVDGSVRGASSEHVHPAAIESLNVIKDMLVGCDSTADRDALLATHFSSFNRCIHHDVCFFSGTPSCCLVCPRLRGLGSRVWGLGSRVSISL
jgi:hypothetical protein